MKPNALWMVSLAMVMTLLSPGLYALALADLELKSSLNQPLDVRIRLLTSAPDDLDGLVVTVAGGSISNVGLGISNLKHEIIQDKTGNYLKVTTKDPIREPILSLVVEMRWKSGHVTREYSLLIDPVVQK